MTDERNIAHDKTVAQDKKDHGQAVVENASVVPQPGRKPPLLDDDTGPSNSVAHEMYKRGEEPRVHDRGEDPTVHGHDDGDDAASEPKTP